LISASALAGAVSEVIATSASVSPAVLSTSLRKTAAEVFAKVAIRLPSRSAIVEIPADGRATMRYSPSVTVMTMRASGCSSDMRSVWVPALPARSAIPSVTGADPLAVRPPTPLESWESVAFHRLGTPPLAVTTVPGGTFVDASSTGPNSSTELCPTTASGCGGAAGGAGGSGGGAPAQAARASATTGASRNALRMTGLLVDRVLTRLVPPRRPGRAPPTRPGRGPRRAPGSPRSTAGRRRRHRRRTGSGRSGTTGPGGTRR
jgi:hypothetical protein